MIVVLLVAVVLFGLLLRRRAARKRVLAGLVATRPTFAVEPPQRRIGKRSGEAL